jgi:hypothetical protein
MPEKCDACQRPIGETDLDWRQIGIDMGSHYAIICGDCLRAGDEDDE